VGDGDLRKSPVVTAMEEEAKGADMVKAEIGAQDVIAADIESK